jgi:hypothetical protein
MPKNPSPEGYSPSKCGLSASCAPVRSEPKLQAVLSVLAPATDENAEMADAPLNKRVSA